jgi:hypothetical protein
MELLSCADESHGGKCAQAANVQQATVAIIAWLSTRVFRFGKE